MSSKNDVASTNPAASPLRSVLTLVSGTGISHLATFLAAPALTRIYSPEDFSALALFAAVTALLVVVAGGRYEMAIVLPRRDRTAVAVAILSLGIALLTCFIVGVFSLWLTEPVMDALGQTSVPLRYWLIVPVVMIGLGTQAATQWHFRKSHLRRIAVANAAGVGATLVLQIIGGLAFPLVSGGDALVLGHLAGRLTALGLLAPGLVAAVGRQLPRIRLQLLRKVASRYWRFPAFNSLSELVAQGSAEAPRFIFGLFFPAKTLGFFSLCTRVLNKPIAMIAAAANPVFYKLFADMKNAREAPRALLLRSTLALAALIALPTAVLMFWGRPLFKIAFGPQWTEAGDYARLLAPLLAVRFIVLPTWTALLAAGKQHVVLFWNLSHFVVAVHCLLVGVTEQATDVSLLAYSCGGCAMHLLLLAINFYYAGQSRRSPSLSVRRAADITAVSH